MTERKNRQHRRNKEGIELARKIRLYAEPIIEMRDSLELSTRPTEEELEIFYGRWEEIKGARYVEGLREIISSYLERKNKN